MERKNITIRHYYTQGAKQTTDALYIAFINVMGFFVVSSCIVQCSENGIAVIARHVKMVDYEFIVLIIVVSFGSFGMLLLYMVLYANRRLERLFTNITCKTFFIHWP